MGNLINESSDTTLKYMGKKSYEITKLILYDMITTKQQNGDDMLKYILYSSIGLGDITGKKAFTNTCMQELIGMLEDMWHITNYRINYEICKWKL